MVVAAPVLVRRERGSKYGLVDGLDEEELADPDELARQVVRQEFEAILMVPRARRRSDISPAIDEAGGVDWGAFGTVDFERYSGGFDKARYKADKLRERLKDKLIMLAIVKERLPGKAKYLVLRHLRMGIIELEDITSEDMLAAAKLYLEARKLQRELHEAEETSRRGKHRAMEAWLEEE
ncbi:hypothetical protein ACFL09_02700 [Planctomycetota bacterium]